MNNFRVFVFIRSQYGAAPPPSPDPRGAPGKGLPGSPDGRSKATVGRAGCPLAVPSFVPLLTLLLHSQGDEEGTPQQLSGNRKDPPSLTIPNIAHSNIFKSFIQFLLFQMDQNEQFVLSGLRCHVPGPPGPAGITKVQMLGRN